VPRVARLALLGALAALLAACGGGGEAGEAVVPVEVELVVVTGVTSESRFEVRCGPTGGTTPDPEATCAAIAANPEMLAPPELTATCAGSLGIPPEARVGGTAGGRLVDLAVRECEAAGLSSD
jgi:hypothetical protein